MWGLGSQSRQLDSQSVAVTLELTESAEQSQNKTHIHICCKIHRAGGELIFLLNFHYGDICIHYDPYLLIYINALFWNKELISDIFSFSNDINDNSKDT